MCGTTCVMLLTALLVGPEIEPARHVVRIDHTTAQFLEGEPEPVPELLCRLEVVSGRDGAFDTRARFGAATVEFSGGVSRAANGKLCVEVGYAYLVDAGNGGPLDVTSVQSSAELDPGDSVLFGGLETRTSNVVDGVTAPTRVRRDSIRLSVHRHRSQ